MVGRRNMCAPTRLCDAMGADYAVTLLGKGGRIGGMRRLKLVEGYRRQGESCSALRPSFRISRMSFNTFPLAPSRQRREEEYFDKTQSWLRKD